ncbi:hypothetical protein N7E02_21945 [Aliirhizobium terrae]|uniref:hypothetical protein n=1 Tax=Terrirhizobium terrae TaxID=2926709 RepID=UPI0025766F32|nr:hypothetical protein [Rhizobium sp. CC-CFT758]WJH39460.1 hypothetical protein N7E02_21945 [Rhizobium sp. CC-CFT758]
MPTIARRLTILTLMMSIFAISFAALAIHNPRNMACPAGSLGLSLSSQCVTVF